MGHGTTGTVAPLNVAIHGARRAAISGMAIRRRITTRKSTVRDSRRNTSQESSNKENQKPNAQLDSRGALKSGGPCLTRQLGLYPPEIVCPDRGRNCNEEQLHHEHLSVCRLPHGGER